MAEAATETLTQPATEPVVTEVPVEEKPTLAPPEPELSAVEDDDKEPGGSDPQAVRARKEYRARKRYETALTHERDLRIAAEARAQALTEQRAAPAKQEPQRRYSASELQQAIDAGSITAVEAADYLAKVHSEETAARVLQSERVKADVEQRYGQAASVLQQYVAEVPWLTDKTDARYSKLEAEYARLTDPTGLYRLPRDASTDVLVLERMVGSLDKLRRAKEVQGRTDMHVESGAGGVGAKGVSGAQSGANRTLDKMPAHYHTYWEKTNTSQADREKEAAIYWKRQADRATGSR